MGEAERNEQVRSNEEKEAERVKEGTRVGKAGAARRTTKESEWRRKGWRRTLRTGGRAESRHYILGGPPSPPHLGLSHT